MPRCSAILLRECRQPGAVPPHTTFDLRRERSYLKQSEGGGEGGVGGGCLKEGEGILSHCCFCCLAPPTGTPELSLHLLRWHVDNVPWNAEIFLAHQALSGSVGNEESSDRNIAAHVTVTAQVFRPPVDFLRVCFLELGQLAEVGKGTASLLQGLWREATCVPLDYPSPTHIGSTKRTRSV